MCIWFSQLLVDLAKARNSIPLPKIIGGYGISLPPEVDTLIYPNYQLILPTRPSFPDMENDIEWEDDDDKDETAKEPVQPTHLQDHGRKVSFAIAGKGLPRHCRIEASTPNGIMYIHTYWIWIHVSLSLYSFKRVADADAGRELHDATRLLSWGSERLYNHRELCLSPCDQERLHIAVCHIWPSRSIHEYLQIHWPENGFTLLYYSAMLCP